MKFDGVIFSRFGFSAERKMEEQCLCTTHFPIWLPSIGKNKMAQFSETYSIRE